jgi:hypothetical protein
MARQFLQRRTSSGEISTSEDHTRLVGVLPAGFPAGISVSGSRTY